MSEAVQIELIHAMVAVASAIIAAIASGLVYYGRGRATPRAEDLERIEELEGKLDQVRNSPPPARPS